MHQAQHSSNAHPGLRPWQGALVGVAAGTIYGLLGFFLLRHFESPHMGEAFFIILPFAVGATIAFVTPKPVETVALLAATISLVICLVALVSMHAEGLLCAALAFPLIFFPVVLGVGIGLLLRQFIRPFQNYTSNCLIFLAAPALVFAGHRLEMKSLAGPRTQNVVTTLHLPATPEQVWTNIQSLEKIAGKRPLLMFIGLPVPQRCVLNGIAVGSKRICYFDQGFIEETILEWDPPRRMRLSVNRTNMPGRHWLDFDGAQYDLRADAGGTWITRVTTIRSNLSPAWYWSRFEKWGVESEHEYLFSDLASRFPVGNRP